MALISKETVKRLPKYLRYLVNLDKEGQEYASSTVIANHFNWSAVGVRKDLASIASCSGQPKKGFLVKTLINDINSYMGLLNQKQVILIGVGKLGQALLGYTSFKKFGLEIIAAFDVDSPLIGQKFLDKPVFSMSMLETVVKKMDVKIAIVTVPKESAQEVVDQVVACGIKGIWNFAPVQINVKEGVVVKSEDMAASLAILSQQVFEKSHQND